MLGRYKKRILNYLNKDKFDYKQGFVDPFEYHTWFYFYAKVYGIMDYDKRPYWTYISPVIGISTALMGFVFTISSLRVYIRDFDIALITECGAYVLLLFYQFLINYGGLTDKKHYNCLMRALREDFQYICTKGIRYRDRFFENQKETFKSTALSSVFVACIGGGISVIACFSLAIHVVLHGFKGNNRPRVYAFCFDGVDMQATPVYEIMFLIAIEISISYAHTYIFTMSIHVVWVRHIMCKADIIIWSIQDLLEDVFPTKNKNEEEYYSQLICSRMREIVSRHHSMFILMEEYAGAYRKYLMYEQKLAAPALCMTAYGVAVKYDEGEIQYVLMMLCCAVAVVTFIPSYLCTLLLEKLQSISDACWDTPFWNAGPVVLPYLVIIMQRSMRQLPIAAAGFENISLETYSNMLTRAYSCFNMLRQRGG